MRLLEYLIEQLPGDLDAERQFRLVVLVFFLTFLSVIVVHLFMPATQSWWEVVVHALVIGATYLASFTVAALCLHALGQALTRRIRVWHLWLFSFAAFNLGYFAFEPLGGERIAMHSDVQTAHAVSHYLRLLPIWLLISWVFIESYHRQSLQDALRQVQRINESLARPAPEAQPAGRSEVDFTTPRRPLTLHPEAISHICVIDHYCYIHHRAENGGWEKSDVGLPLKEVARHMPDTFLPVHRSYLVNAAFIRHIDREGRNYTLTMENGDILPISRNRRAEVLPALEAS